MKRPGVKNTGRLARLRRVMNTFSQIPLSSNTHNIRKPKEIFSVHSKETLKLHPSCTKLSITGFLRSNIDI